MHMGSLGEWHVDWDSILLACEWNRMYTNYIKRANHSIYSVQSTVFLFNQFFFWSQNGSFGWSVKKKKKEKEKRKEEEEKMKVGIVSERARVPDMVVKIPIWIQWFTIPFGQNDLDLTRIFAIIQDW